MEAYLCYKIYGQFSKRKASKDNESDSYGRIELASRDWTRNHGSERHRNTGSYID